MAAVLGPESDKQEAVIEHLLHSQREKPLFFLMEETDLFVQQEMENGYPALVEFRKLSEEGKCYFIFAGFWQLYAAVTFDYQSPVKNFGETLILGELEKKACIDLCTKPMEALNISFVDESIINKIIFLAKQRPNLIAIICNALISLDPKLITQSLERLELAFILNREKSTYSYKVPLFTQYLKERDCTRLYEWEIKSLKSIL